MPRRSSVYVPLVGGLGNQLFGLSYCFWLNENGHSAIPYSNVRRTQTKFHPQHFDLLHEVRKKSTKLKTASLAQTWVMCGLASIAGFLQRLGLQVMWLETRNAAGDVNPPGRHSKIVRGYFQDAVVAEKSISAVHSLLARSFQSACGVVGNWRELDVPHITVHYRRGDYLNHIDTIGLLSDDYFVKACEEARKESGINSVRLISDGCSRALEARLRGRGFECEVVASHDLSPIELLLAFARLSGYVAVSNSSFSWWGAALNEKVKVICPEPWFKSEELFDLSLPTWRKLEAEWANSTSSEM